MTTPDSECISEQEKKLLEAVKSMSSHDPEMKTYADKGEFRTQEPLSDRQKQIVQKMMEFAECEPKQCYRNAQLMAINSDDLVYCEGVTSISGIPIPTKHAWVEIDGKVAEVTMADGTPSKEMAYFGMTYTTREVRESLEANDWKCYPIAADRSRNDV